MGKRRLATGRITNLIKAFNKKIKWSAPFGGQTTQIENIATTSTNLTARQSGTFFTITGTLFGTYTITIPSATAENIGWYCSFFNEDTLLTNCYINTGRVADLFIGNVFVADHNDAAVGKKIVYAADVATHNSMDQRWEYSLSKITIVGVNRVLVQGMLGDLSGGATDPFTTQ